jgi:hypothetical protein
MRRWEYCPCRVFAKGARATVCVNDRCVCCQNTSRGETHDQVDVYRTSDYARRKPTFPAEVFTGDVGGIVRGMVVGAAVLIMFVSVASEYCGPKVHSLSRTTTTWQLLQVDDFWVVCDQAFFVLNISCLDCDIRSLPVAPMMDLRFPSLHLDQQQRKGAQPVEASFGNRSVAI